MSTSGLLDFFVLEGSEYAERLDGLLAGAGGAQPDALPFSQAARALRGSATMAKLGPMAEMAGALERVARGLRERQVAWSPALRAALVAAVDDAKLLIRAARTWGAAEDQRAAARTAELQRYAPQRPAMGTPQAVGSVTFMAAETAEVGRALQAFLARPTDTEGFAAMVERVRALRGVAALKDLPPLSEVVDAIERVAKQLELAVGSASGPGASGALPALPPQAFAVLTAAGELLHRAAGEIRIAGRPDVNSPPAQRFAAAAAALGGSDGAADRIVPIATLYFGDEGPHVIARAPNPPTTPAERFRLEVVSQAEHLRRLVHEARGAASDPTTRQRLSRELRGAMRALHDAAESFGEREVADFVGRVGEGVTSLDARPLAELDEVARHLADPRSRPSELARRLEQFRLGEPVPTVGEPQLSTPASGSELKKLLKSSLEGMATLERDAMGSGELAAELVPIDALLYRGPRALARAREVRDVLRARGGAPDPDLIDELYDLLDLAAVE